MKVYISCRTIVSIYLYIHTLFYVVYTIVDENRKTEVFLVKDYFTFKVLSSSLTLENIFIKGLIFISPG